jgi:hypothetical protein
MTPDSLLLWWGWHGFTEIAEAMQPHSENSLSGAISPHAGSMVRFFDRPGD